MSVLMSGVLELAALYDGRLHFSVLFFVLYTILRFSNSTILRSYHESIHAGSPGFYSYGN